jgi:peptidoglycan-associated lipoprotein
MISGVAARYVFAACLAASVVDLLIVDFVIGPMAFERGSDAAAATAALPLDAAGGAAQAEPTGTAVALDPSDAGAGAGAEPRAPRPRSRVVARFDSDQQAANDDELRALAAAMLADPTAEIVLEGHTDQRGDPEKNRLLSLERATWAQSRLVDAGVSASRIAVVGIGAERPLEHGDDDAAVASNRRVEVRWISGAPSRDDGDR